MNNRYNNTTHNERYTNCFREYLVVIDINMSSEKINYNEQNNNISNQSLLSKARISGRVDINDLLSRARKEKEKENKINIVYIGLTATLVLVVGILLTI